MPSVCSITGSMEATIVPPESKGAGRVGEDGSISVPPVADLGFVKSAKPLESSVLLIDDEQNESEDLEEWWSSAESLTSDSEDDEDWWSSVDSFSDSNDDSGSDSDDDSGEDEDSAPWLKLEKNLQAVVARLLPGEDCVTARFYANGSSHIVMELQLRSGRVILARLACCLDRGGTAPAFAPFKERSEVATLRYLRAYTTIPVAEVYAFDDDENNEVDGDISLQELIPGLDVVTAWPCLTQAARRSVLQQISDIQLQLFHHDFDTIGSLQDTVASTGQRLFTIGPLAETKDAELDYVIGPPPEPGPWSIPREWLATIARGGLDYQTEPDRYNVRDDRESVSCLTELVRRLDNGVPCDGDLAVCGLLHPDFTLHNILIGPALDGSAAIITGVLDWEGARSVPRWAMAGRSDFADARFLLSEEELEHYDALLMQDPLFARAREEGRKARALHRLCLNTIPGKGADEFEAGNWGDDVTHWT